MLRMKPRVIFVHGNSTTHWSYGWAPWLREQLEAAGHPTFFETMPDSVIARAEYWLPFLHDHVGAGADDVIVGWSSGAVAAMRYAEQHPLLGAVLVSPSHTDLGDDLERQSGYFDGPWNWPVIRSNLGRTALVWGDDDPYIPQSEFTFLADQLSPVRLQIAGGGHFTDRDRFPELADHLVRTFA